MLATPALASAGPQWNAGFVAAGCALSGPQNKLERIAFCGELRGDVLFGRARVGDFGAGPYLAIGTAAFEDTRVATGVSLLLPVIEDFPLVFSAGGLATDSGQLGLDLTTFFGVRSYDHYGAYNFAAGAVIGAERTFGERSSTALSLGLQIDGLIVALPFLLAWGALK